jgi:hypothetical protein
MIGRYGGYLNKLQIGRFRAIREKESLKKNPQFSFGTKERLAAYGEAGLLWTIFNVVVDGEVNGLRVEDVVQFLGEEKLPLKYQRPAQPVELKEIVQVGREIYRYSK